MARWFSAQGKLGKLGKRAKTCRDDDVTHRKPQIQMKKFFKSKLDNLPNP